MVTHHQEIFNYLHRQRQDFQLTSRLPYQIYIKLRLTFKWSAVVCHVGPLVAIPLSIFLHLTPLSQKYINNKQLYPHHQSNLSSPSSISIIFYKSIKDSLSPGSGLSIPLSNFYSIWNSGIFSSNSLFYICAIIFCSERSFFDNPNGNSPVANSKRVIPTLQTSHFPISFILTEEPLKI